ncbi:hypothetical protein AVEN_142431-1 [Araneus ventricosus]|uniref:Uncharacterized protein n=1 Tax=Araneus ventricosus TaxID=182803 RepID=A0A4Y2VD29_ARAVE|nr:hypothetical protein AVEN_2650-1 [Araneus ventricosus]GBO22294.1 hypothetical protein AVEN_142431-1 [Araneus ventricosus]
MGNLISEENGEPQSHVELKENFLINLILTEIQSKCHIALAVAPSIAIRHLDGDRTALSPLQLPLVLLKLRILYAIQAKGLMKRLSNKLQTYYLG